MSSEMWSQVFLGSFLVGLFTIAAMLLLGVGQHAHGHGGHAGHGHGGAGHGAQASHSGSAVMRGALGAILPLNNLPSLLALLTAGGAAGYIALHLGTSLFSSRLVALGVGLLGAQAMALAMRLLARAEAGVVVPLDERGTVARATAKIAPGRVGEIVLRRDGKRQALPARGDDESVVLERGAEVVVMRIERGVAYVRAASDLFETEGEGK